MFRHAREEGRCCPLEYLKIATRGCYSNITVLIQLLCLISVSILVIFIWLYAYLSQNTMHCTSPSWIVTQSENMGEYLTVYNTIISIP